MKLITIILGSILCISTFAQDKSNIKEVKSLKGATAKEYVAPSTITNNSGTTTNEAQHLSFKSPEGTKNQTVELKEVEKFVEVPATGFTDPNYEKNLAKSKVQQERLNETPSIVNLKLTDDQKIANYKIELQKHEVNSVEYNHILAKMNKLKSIK